MDNSSIKSFLRSPAPITIVSLAVVYALAFAIDTAFYQLKKYTKATFDFRYTRILTIIVPVVVVIGILALTWLALHYLPPSRFVATAFMVSGVFVIGAYLSVFVGFPSWLRTTIIGRFRYAMMNFGFKASIYYIASACIIIGIAALRRHALNRQSFQDK